MAFNWQTFWTRTLIGAIFVTIMVLGLWDRWTFLLLFSVIHFGCWWEYLRLIEKIHRVNFHIYVKLGLMVIGYGLMLWFCSPYYEIRGYGFRENLSLPVSLAGFGILLIGIFQKDRVRLKPFGTAALGILYISLCWGFMIDFYTGTEYHFYGTSFLLAPDAIPVIIFTSIWVNDTMAYLVGSMIGKTPLSKISPKKTWEGTIGGIILCFVAVSLLLPFLFRNHSFVFSIFLAILSAIIAISGTFGDLLESRLKRLANVKDSGKLMPAHGGFLDRFDSMLFATPFVWLFIKLFLD